MHCSNWRHKGRKIQFYVDGIILHPRLTQNLADLGEGEHIGNARLQAVLDDIFVGICSGGKHQDRQADTGLAQLYAFYRKRSTPSTGSATAM